MYHDYSHITPATKERAEIRKVITEFLNGDFGSNYSRTPLEDKLNGDYDYILKVVKYLYKHHRKLYYCLCGYSVKNSKGEYVNGKAFKDKIVGGYNSYFTMPDQKYDYYYIYY